MLESCRYLYKEIHHHTELMARRLQCSTTSFVWQ